MDFDWTLSIFDSDAVNSMTDLVDALNSQGIKSYIVTYRSESRREGNADVIAMAKRLNVEIIYTNGRAKAGFIDGDVIWMDDQPATILFDRGDIDGSV